MAGNVDNVDTNVTGATTVCRDLGRDRIEASCDDDAGNVAHWHGIDGVDDVRAARQLDAALEHADEEIVIVANASGSVAENVARSDDRAEETSSTSLADELFRHLEYIVSIVSACRKVVASYSPTWSGRNQCRGRRDCPSCRLLP